MKKFKIFALVLVLGSILVLGTGCLQNAGVNQENEELMPEQIMPETTEPSVVVPPVEIPAPEILAPEIPAPVSPLP